MLSFGEKSDEPRTCDLPAVAAWGHLPRTVHGPNGAGEDLPWENHRENHGKTMGNGGLMGFNGIYSLIMTNITMEHHNLK